MSALASYRTLFSRYREAFAEAWRNRLALNPPTRTAEELEFLPSAMSLRDTPVHPLPRKLLMGLFVMLAMTVAWSIIGRTDIVAVGRGKVVLGTGSKALQATELSTINAIYVRNGQHVQKGDILVEFDSSVARAELSKIHAAIAARQIDIAIANSMLNSISRREPPTTLATELKGMPPEAIQRADIRLFSSFRSMRSQINEKESELRQLEVQQAAERASLAALKAMSPLSSELAESNRILSERDIVSRRQFLEYEQQRLSHEKDIIIKDNDIKKILALRDVYMDQKASILSRWNQDMVTMQNSAHEELTTLNEERSKAEHRVQLTEIVAPVNGTVQQVSVKTVGGVVQEAQPVLVVVPDDGPIEVEVKLQNKDIGFVNRGMPVEIKFDAFDYTKYGVVEGFVDSVSTDSIDDQQIGSVYDLRILIKSAPINFNIISGMAVSAEIKVGSRRIIEYFLSPLNTYITESFREV